MKVVIAPDSFKECLPAPQVAEALREGVLRAFPDCDVDLIPMGDGGEGTLSAILEAHQGEVYELDVLNPLGEKIVARYGIFDSGETAFVELAEASGLALVRPEQRDALRASSYGTGQVIADALNQGVYEIIVALGGSAMTDGGSGALAALGAKLLDKDGLELEPGGAALRDLERINLEGLHPGLLEVKLSFACDVDNPLLGETGSAKIYGPQKGASQDGVEILEQGMTRFIDLLEKQTGNRVRNIPGIGAAGGFAAAFICSGIGKLERGVELVARLVSLDQRVKDSDVVITGEGRVDSQTRFGKVPMGVARVAKQYSKPVLLIAGSLGSGYEVLYDEGISTITSLTENGISKEEAIREAYKLLAIKAESVMRSVDLGGI